MPTDAPSSAPPAGASGGACFYRPDNYSADESIGLLMRRIITAVSQAVETELVEPGGPT